MVKVELSDELDVVKYPILMTTEKNIVVLMTSDGCGTVVSQGRGILPVGEYRTDFIMDIFSPYTGTITLSNA